MHTLKNKNLMDESLSSSIFLIDINEDDDDFFDKITDLAVKGQEKLMQDSWSKGLPWIYINENGEKVRDYGNRKEYF